MNTFKYLKIHSNAFRYIEIYYKHIKIYYKYTINTFKYIQVHSNTFKYIEIHYKYIEIHHNYIMNTFKYIQIYYKCIKLHHIYVETMLKPLYSALLCLVTTLFFKTVPRLIILPKYRALAMTCLLKSKNEAFSMNLINLIGS
jgi:hypothetical protein